MTNYLECTHKKRQETVPAESIEMLKTIIEGAKEYLTIKESEKTKRCELEASMRVNLERIRSQRQCLESYLEKSFGERRKTLDSLFERLDIALSSNDKNDVAIQALSSIEGIVKSSPLEDLLATRRELESQDGILEI